MFKPLNDEEFKRFVDRVQTAARLVGATNLEIYGSSPEDGIGAVVVFDSTDGDRCAGVFEASMARKYTSEKIAQALKLAVDEVRSTFDSDPTLSDINPPVDFSTLKRYQLRWLDPPFASSEFQPIADRIHPDQWKMMVSNLKLSLRQTVMERIEAQSVIDYEALETLRLVSDCVADGIEMAGVAKIAHYRVLQAEELVLFLMLVLGTREAIREGLEQLKNAGEELIIISDSDVGR